MAQRLLFLSHNIPFPPDSGAKIRTFNILRQLSEVFDIAARCVFRGRGSAGHTAENRAGIEPYAKTEVFEFPHETNLFRSGWDHLRSVATLRVYTYYMYQSARFRASVQALLAEGGFSLVHIDSLDLSCYLPEAVASVPTICTHHNVESLLLERRARKATSRALGTYLSLQSHLMEKEEREWCPRVSLNITVSHFDAEALNQIAPGCRTAVVPNGVDTNFFVPQAAPEQGIVFCRRKFMVSQSRCTRVFRCRHPSHTSCERNTRESHLGG